MGKSVKTILIGLTLTLGACSSGSGGGNINKFVGVWAPSAGTFTITCAGQSQTSLVTDTVTWTAGTTSDLVQTIPGTTCVFHADVTSLTATGVPGQTCNVESTSGGDSITDHLSISAYTFSLSADGLTGTESYSGTDTETDNTTGQSINCTFSQQAMYSKQ
jgi:hypothetical protein